MNEVGKNWKIEKNGYFEYAKKGKKRQICMSICKKSIIE